MIKQVTKILDAKICDEFLTELILDEQKYDSTIDKDFKVSDYFPNIINNKEYYLLGYYIENEIVGYILIKFVDQNNKICLIDGLYVKKEHRNKKIATSLVDEALKICNEKEYKHIDINVMYENNIAKKLYKKFGFEEFKVNLRKNL
ncbi:MAG: GNAT family N-acetyltransferase [Tenericutes bacterium]|nr:GNAT family N-acetyltransferase [Mycoplasmatota bacterium]